MTLRLYNTLSGNKQNFTPQNASEVSMYVCGPTVYNYAHIGNARPAVVFDLLYRLLCYLYPEKKIRYARNVTDIDDKIIVKAEEDKLPTTAIAQRYYQCYQADMKALHVLPPPREPWATEHMKDIIECVKDLLAKNHAYVAEGHVLFDVTSYLHYGCLSRQKRSERQAGARVEVASYKRDVSDFVLWKPSHSKQPGWESPWGRGRPGWHIECSAMIRSLFQGSIDIHGGGQDLIFPHHENENAQSVCMTDDLHSVAHFWLHNAFVRMGQEKMSKSLGNVRLLRDILQKVPGETVRLALLMTHYRSPLDWNEKLIAQAQAHLHRFYECLHKLDAKETTPSIAKPNDDFLNKKLAKLRLPSAFVEALCDDMNTAKALAVMHELTSQLNSGGQNQKEQTKSLEELRSCGYLLGILNTTPQDWLQKQMSQGMEHSVEHSAIEKLIKERNNARQENDYARSDEIRDELARQGVVLKDTAKKTEWYYK